MSSWPDDGALVMKWKKANEVRRTKVVFNDFTSRKVEKLFFHNFFFQFL